MVLCIFGSDNVSKMYRPFPSSFFKWCIMYQTLVSDIIDLKIRPILTVAFKSSSRVQNVWLNLFWIFEIKKKYTYIRLYKIECMDRLIFYRDYKEYQYRVDDASEKQIIWVLELSVLSEIWVLFLLYMTTLVLSFFCFSLKKTKQFNSWLHRGL